MSVASLLEPLRGLPPPPWTAYGDSVYAGNKVICTCIGGDGPRVAESIAKLPDILRVLAAASPEILSARIEELEKENDELRQYVTAAAEW